MPHRKDLDQLDAFRLEAKISVVKAKQALIRKWKAKRNVIPIENDYPRMILWTILLNAIRILVMIVCKSNGLMKKKPANDDKAKESQDEDDHKVSPEDFQRLLLERRGLKVVEEIKDGNCLFRCGARHIYSDPELFQIVRFECVEFMRANEALFGEFILSDFGKYLETMAKNATWGGDIEVSALAQRYGLRIEVYQDRSLLPFLIFGAADAEIVRVFYVNRTHYDSILPDIRASIQQE